MWCASGRRSSHRFRVSAGWVACALVIAFCVSLTPPRTAAAPQPGGSIFDDPLPGQPPRPPKAQEPAPPPKAPGDSKPPPAQGQPPRPPPFGRQLPPPTVPAPPGPLLSAPALEQRGDGPWSESYDDPALQRLRTVHSGYDFGHFSAVGTSARWTGLLVAPRDGTYHIRAECTGQFRLWVDDRLAIQ